jgi:hypothetical protein
MVDVGVEEDQEARSAHHCQPLDLQPMDRPTGYLILIGLEH